MSCIRRRTVQCPALIPKNSDEGCFGVVSHFGGGGYTSCSIDNAGHATCEAKTLPDACLDPRHVASLPDRSFLFTCENHQLMVQVPAPDQ